MFEEDYLIRQIKECVAAAVKLLFGKEIDNVAALEFETMEKKELSDKLILQVDKGNVRAAISEMYLNSNDKTQDDLVMALMVYTHIYEKDDDFLDASSISISEIKDSARKYFSEFGIADISKLIIPE